MYNQPTSSQHTGLEFGVGTRALIQHKQEPADDDSRRGKQAQAQHECHIYRLGFKTGQVLGGHIRRAQRRCQGLDRQLMGIGERRRRGWGLGWKQISILGAMGIGLACSLRSPSSAWKGGWRRFGARMLAN
jgi:hypothetical protein